MLKIFEFLKNTKLIGSKITAVGAIAFGVYLMTQGDIATGSATIAGGWAALIGSNIAGKIDAKVEQVSAKVDVVSEQVVVVQAATDATAAVVGAVPAETVPLPPSMSESVPSQRFNQTFPAAGLVLLLMAGFSFAGDREVRVKVALALASAQQEAVTAEAVAAAVAKVSYCDARETAEKTKKPLVVFVGQPSRPVSGAVVVSVPDFVGVDGEGVVIGTPSDGKIIRYADISGRPTNAAIGRHLNEVCKDGVCFAPSRVLTPNGSFFQFAECPTCPKR